MSGSCAAPNEAIVWKDACEAIGSCDAPSAAASEDACGTCSEPSAVKADACASASATWTPGTWTTTGVWEEPENSWTGEFHHTDHVVSVDGNADYACYDKDITDHVGKCSNGADTPSGTDCAADFAAGSTFEKDSCATDAPGNCVWTAAPVSPIAKPAHPAAEPMDGYNTFSGACRSTSPANKADPSAPQMQDRPSYMYKKNAAFPAFPAGTSPADLAAMCDQINVNHRAFPDTHKAVCLGFHSGPWMSIFGLGMTDEGSHQREGWTGYDEGSGTNTLEGTKPNHQYLCFINLSPPMPSGWWYFNDGYKRSWSGALSDPSAKPKVVCHIDVCESLWEMGVREDQIVGYFNGNPATWTGLCEGAHCKTGHFELIPFVGDDGTLGLDMGKIDEVKPDMIVDVAYCGMDSNAPQDKAGCYKENACELHSFKYGSKNASETCRLIADKQMSYITVNVMQGYIEAVDSVQRLAITLGDLPNPDTVNYCKDFHEAMTAMQVTAEAMHGKGLRVTTMYLGGTTIYAAQPTDDPILIMLEELGVPMTHVTVTDPRGHYWEKYDFNSSMPSGQQTSSIRPGGGRIWETDVWMYDTRTHDTHFGSAAVPLEEQFADPAWAAGQIAPWPIGSAVGFSYKAGTRVLNMLRNVFDKAELIKPAGSCTDVDVSKRSRLQGGEFACFNPKPMFPSCPVAGSPNPVVEWQAKAREEGWVPCPQKAAARQRRLAALEAEVAEPRPGEKVMKRKLQIDAAHPPGKQRLGQIRVEDDDEL
jgi:hypothetical protein